MLDNKDTILDNLRTIGLSADEVEVYLQLLPQPGTYLKLSRDTGITRSKVYRIIDRLAAKSLVSHYTDDRGTFIKASDPSALEIDVLTSEARLQQQQQALQSVLPLLAPLVGSDPRRFIVRTYEGEEGLKQMCWHELKAEGTLLTFGYSTIENLIPNRRWSEEHRQRTVDANYHIRDLINDTDDHEPTFTDNPAFMERYNCRIIPQRLLPLPNQTIIYNDTVSIYHTAGGQRIGVEIINAAYAGTMRAIFNHYWDMAVDA